jgi:hypothetical protein
MKTNLEILTSLQIAVGQISVNSQFAEALSKDESVTETGKTVSEELAILTSAIQLPYLQLITHATPELLADVKHLHGDDQPAEIKVKRNTVNGREV